MLATLRRPSPHVAVAKGIPPMLNSTPEGHALQRLMAERGRHAGLHTLIAEAYERLVHDGVGVDPTPMALSSNAMEVVSKRYLLKDLHTGAVIETPNDMCARVASKLASNVLNYLTDDDIRIKTEQQIAERIYERYKRYYEALRSISVLPAGRTLANPDFSVPNCVVLHIQDNLDDIMMTMRDAALLQQKGSGIGFPLHLMRPTGAITKTSGGTSSGPVSFLRVYNAAFGTIKQQNRHGANMAIMKVTHPDILEFVHCKSKEGNIKNFNISVGLTNEFMKQVVEECKEPWRPVFGDKEWPLRRITRDQDGAVTSTEEVVMTASEVFREIVKAAWSNGEPGCVFLDRVNEDNPLPNLGPIEASNPCVTADTWVNTAEGPRQVKDVVDRPTDLYTPVKSPVFSKTTGFFSTGVKEIFEIVTDDGFDIKATANHRFMTPGGEWIKVTDLKHGSELLVACNNSANWPGEGTKEQGYLLGYLLGDGTLKKLQAVLPVWETPGSMGIIAEVNGAVKKEFNFEYTWTQIEGRDEQRLQSRHLLQLCHKFGMKQGEKQITDTIEKASREFYIGFLRGLFDADGSVQGSVAKGRSIRLSQSNYETLQRVQRMLCRLGIMSRIYLRREEGFRDLPDGAGSVKSYKCKTQFELIITRKSMEVYRNIIGFADTAKCAALEASFENNKRALYRDSFSVSVKEVVSRGVQEVFDVTVNHESHCYDSNGLISHNCGEQFLHDGDVCNLGALNATKIYNTETGELNEAILRENVKTGIMMLEDVVDTFKLPVEKVSSMARKTRRTGLGLFGWAEYLILRGIAYDSEENLAEIRHFMGIFKETAIEVSRELAKERGVFPLWHTSVYAKDDDKRRNAFLSSMAPTGTTSMIADLSGGVEPLFKVAYVKKNVLGGSEFRYINPLLLEALKNHGLDSNKELVDEILAKGTVHQLKDKLPEAVVRVFRTAESISPEWHVRVQAEFQKYVDNAISKTCNFPEDATIQDVINAYIEAWRLRCKGLTVYRSNSRQYQVLESLEEAERKRKKKTTDAVPMDGVSQGHHHHQLAVSADSTNKLVEQRRYRPAAGMAKPTCCPVCESSDNVLHTEGCVKCLCGWSAC